MRRALLASLALHGVLLAVLLMQRGSGVPAPAALTVQLLPPAPATVTARAAPAAPLRAGKPVARAVVAPAAGPRPAPLAPVPATAATVPLAAASLAANPLPPHDSVAVAPAALAAQGGSVAAAREGSGRSPPAAPVADRAARVLQMPDPDYPPLSRERGEQGVVLLQLAVQPNGVLGEVSVLRSSGFARLDKAARAAVLRWRFQPAIENGQPVAAELTLPVRFALDEN